MKRLRDHNFWKIGLLCNRSRGFLVATIGLTLEFKLFDSSYSAGPTLTYLKDCRCTFKKVHKILIQIIKELLSYARKKRIIALIFKTWERGSSLFPLFPNQSHCKVALRGFITMGLNCFRIHFRGYRRGCFGLY